MVYYRVLATIFIFLCHIFGKSNIPIVQMSSQFFNVGVSMFIVLSGFLYGMNTVKRPIGKWYCKRWLRICISEYIFVLILFVVHLAVSNTIKPLNWIVLLLNLQGVEIYVNGAEHLWYLTVILFCYLITPLLDKLFNKEKPSPVRIWLILLSVASFSVVCAYFIHRHTAIYLVYVLLYMAAFLLGRYQCSFVSNQNVVLCVFVAALFAGFRLVGKFFADGSTLYDVFIVGITQGAIALCLLCAVCSIKKLRSFSALRWFDTISYEFYLVHYMLIVGPVSVMSLTSVSAINCVIVAVVSLGLAWIIHVVGNKVISLIHRPDKAECGFSSGGSKKM